MDWLFVLNIVFILLLASVVAVLFYRDRKKVRLDSILLTRRTKRGIKFIQSVAGRSPRFWKGIGVAGVIVGFLFSVFIFTELLFITSDNMAQGGMPGMGLVRPSFGTDNVILPGLILPQFWYWIIVLAMLVMVHEGMHAMICAAEKVRIKAMGIGMLLILPLAFVEPDEKQLARRSTMTQLRVFAAGSFGNFILAGVALVVLLLFTSGLFVSGGVAFQAYPGAVVKVDSITHIGGVPVSGYSEFRGVLEGFEDGPVNLTADGTLYQARKNVMLKGLDKLDESNFSEDKAALPVYKDYPAARAGLVGFIREIEGKEVGNITYMRRLLVEAGPNKSITVKTLDGDEYRTFTLETEVPSEEEFVPSSKSHLYAWLEQYIPGTIDSTNWVGENIFGHRNQDSWSGLKKEADMWRWVGETYPATSERAFARAAELSEKADGYPMPGHVGIAMVMDYQVLREGLEGYAYPINFLRWLLQWTVLINLGVGMFNLLPIGPLDGGKMWELLLREGLPQKAAKKVIKAFSIFTLIIIVINFALILV